MLAKVTSRPLGLNCIFAKHAAFAHNRAQRQPHTTRMTILLWKQFLYQKENYNESFMVINKFKSNYDQRPVKLLTLCLCIMNYCNSLFEKFLFSFEKKKNF